MKRYIQIEPLGAETRRRENGQSIAQVRSQLTMIKRALGSDPVLANVAHHVDRAIDRLDDVRALALEVLQEMESERLGKPRYANPPPVKRC